MVQRLGFLDLLEIFNLGLQVYDIQMNHDEIGGTFERLERIEAQNKEIIKLLKDRK